MTEAAFHPIKILSVDITQPLPEVSLADTGNGVHGGVFCLVRCGTRPLKVAEFPVSGEVLDPQVLRERMGPLPEITARRKNSGSVTADKTSVVVATRDRADSLARCLDSLLGQKGQPREIVVVDNAPSSTQTADLIAGRYHGSSLIRYVREDFPGLGRAHNAGLEVVSSDFVLFTDDDVVADPYWTEAMASNFDESGRVGCVTGFILPAELETPAQVWTEKHGGFGKGFKRKVYDLKENRPATPLFPFTAGQFGSGANMAFSVKALRRIGGFDPELGAGTAARGGDDLAAFYAVVKSGFQLVYEPEAIVWHYHRRAVSGMERQAFGYGMGLGAYLTKIVVDEPRSTLDLLRAFPAGLAHMVGPTAPKNLRLPSDYPKALIWRERLGILAGASAYLKSRVTARTKSARPATARARGAV